MEIDSIADVAPEHVRISVLAGTAAALAVAVLLVAHGHTALDVATLGR